MKTFIAVLPTGNIHHVVQVSGDDETYVDGMILADGSKIIAITDDVSIHKISETHDWSHESQQLLPRPPKPSEDFSWNVETAEWLQDIEKLRNRKRAQQPYESNQITTFVDGLPYTISDLNALNREVFDLKLRQEQGIEYPIRLEFFTDDGQLVTYSSLKDFLAFKATLLLNCNEQRLIKEQWKADKHRAITLSTTPEAIEAISWELQ